MKLSYGDPPVRSECVESKVAVPEKFEFSSDAVLQAREAHLDSLFGEPLPVWARVRQAVRVLQKQGGSRYARIKGIGTLYVGEEGWEVE